MDIDLQARDFALTAGLEAAVRDAAERHAGAAGDGLRKVTVRVYRLKGSRAGLDKGCLVVADLADGRVVVSSDVSSDLCSAIEQAFSKLGHSVTRPTDDRASAGAYPNGALVGVVTGRRRWPAT